MKLGVLLLSSPYQTEDVDSCIHFVEKALEKGHEVVGIFLLAEGLYNLDRKSVV
jgi:sulfur relay (sulfurtransferase) complex TusBCD TusD component (DsrE family)